MHEIEEKNRRSNTNPNPSDSITSVLLVEDNKINDGDQKFCEIYQR